MESVFLTAKWIKGGMCVFIKKKKKALATFQ